MSKYGVISGPCFSVFELNTEIYGVNLRIQSKYRKMRTRNNSVFGHFSRSDSFKKLYFTLTLRSIGSRFLLLVSCKNVNNTHAYMTIFILLNRMWIRTCIYLLTNMFIFVHMCVWVMKFYGKMHVVFSKNICFRLTWLIRRRVGDLSVCFRIFSFSLTQLRICLRSMLKFLDIRLTHSLLFQSTYQHKKSFALLCKIDAFWKILDHQLLCFNWWFKHLRENIRKKTFERSIQILPISVGKNGADVLQRLNLVSKAIIGISVNTQ